MTNEAVDTGLDLAEGERLLASFRSARIHFEAVDSMNRYDQTRQWPDAMNALSIAQQALVNWLYYDENNFEALVTALKAAQQEYWDVAAKRDEYAEAARSNREALIVELEKVAQLRDDLARVDAERDELQEWARQVTDALDGRPLPIEPDMAPSRIVQLRDDLTRVEAESKHNGELATGYFKQMGEYATKLTAAQARIAELEGSLRWAMEALGHPDNPEFTGLWADYEQARAVLEAQTPSAS